MVQGAQILVDIGYQEFKLITNNPTKIIGLEGYGLKIIDRVGLAPKINKFNKRYIETKRKNASLVHFQQKCRKMKLKTTCSKDLKNNLLNNTIS